MLALFAIVAALPAQDAFEREVELRARALDPELHGTVSSARSDSEDWRERVFAFDALDRWCAAGGGGLDIDLEGWSLMILMDPHPSVRAAAMRMLARAGASTSGTGDLPGVEVGHDARLARAEILSGGLLEDPAWLDPDPRIGRVGLASVCIQRPPDDGAWIAAVSARLEPDFDERGVLERVDELVELGVRARFDAALWQRMEETVRAGAPAAAVLVALGRARVHPPEDPAALVAQWPAEDAWRLVANRARVAARGLGPAAARALLELDPPRFEAFALAVPPPVAAAIALEHPAFDRDARVALWSELRGRPAGWQLDAARPWLAHDRDAEERAEALTTFAASFSADESQETGKLLVLALEDPEPAIAAEAFATLCNADAPGPWLDAIATSWRSMPEPDRIEGLRRLPRGVALAPLREDLLELGWKRPDVRAVVAELLAPFEGDEQVEGSLTVWYFEACSELADEPDEDRRARAEIVGQACARAMYDVSVSGAALQLELGLHNVAPHSDAVGKVVIGLLGRIPLARPRLKLFTSPPTSRRLRVEAALQMASRLAQPEHSSAVLMESYDGLDAVLRGRALRAIGLERGSVGAGFIHRRAAARDALPSEAEAAVEALGPAIGNSREHFEYLLELTRAASSADVRLAALSQVGEYAREGADDAGSFLSARFDELESALASEDGAAFARDELLFEREALLRAMARAEPGRVEAPGAARWPTLEPAAWLRRPLDLARQDFAARARGRSRATPEFRFGGELAFGRVLAERGELGVALAAAGPWWGCDARFLLALAGEAEAGGADGSTVDRLLAAGLIGLFGEAPALDRPRAEFRALRARFALAEAREDWDACEQIVRLLIERRLRRDADARLFERAFGDYDPESGEDGDARLIAALHQVRARRLLAKRYLDGARREAALARAAAGRSRDALDAQRKLEQALDDADQ